MKYLDTMITFREFPDEITLCINITNCPFHCSGCHSPELWKDVGKPLTQRSLERLISENNGITCVGFMGGDPDLVSMLAERVKKLRLKVGWYWGGVIEEKELLEPTFNNFDYIKTGPYIKELGGLDKPSTNQRLYKLVHSNEKVEWINITYKFWKHGEN
jgi:anaerobic ribonucleoside-triphosphate reductase activating protein